MAIGLGSLCFVLGLISVLGMVAAVTAIGNSENFNQQNNNGFNYEFYNYTDYTTSAMDNSTLV